MRVGLVLTLVLAVVAVVPWAPADPLAAGTEPLSVRQERIRRVAADLQGLLARVQPHAAMDRVALYRSYPPETLALKDRGKDAVTLDELLDFVDDEEMPLPVRQKAVEAIVSDGARGQDPALSKDGRGMNRPRAKFSNKVLSVMTGRDPTGRMLARNIMEGLWPGVRERDPDIGDCNPEHRGSCQTARAAWTRYLQR